MPPLSLLSLPSLPSLPPELLRHILQHADIPTLFSLRLVNRALLHAVDHDDALWHLLVRRRFRVSARAARSRRLLAQGGVAWKLLHEQWRAHRRMPASRLTGVTHAVFAAGSGVEGALVWVTVVSADDCRLGGGGKLRLRIVVQNVGGGEGLRLHMDRASFSLTDDGVVGVDRWGALYRRMNQEEGKHGRRRAGEACRSSQRQGVHGTAGDKALPFRMQPRPPSPVTPVPESYSARLVESCVARVADLGVGFGGGVEGRGGDVLEKDDFVVLTMEVEMPRAIFEVDALERLESFQLPVSRDKAEALPLVARFREKAIWENYERLPGGWWVRADTSAAQL